MRRGTTPTIIMNVAGDDLSGDNMYITVRQGALLIIKGPDDITRTTGEDPDTCILSTTYTQEETLSLKAGMEASIQLRIIEADGTVKESGIISLGVVDDVLQEGVLSYA
jgi:hypothetical protein